MINNILTIEDIQHKENRTITYYRLVIKYERQKQFEIIKDFDNVEELKAWCLDHHSNAKSIGYKKEGVNV